MNRFNIRVYGVLIQNQSVLVSDEYIKGNYITKFPGGGLEFGEGTMDCLKREFEEELKLKIEIESHFYTTDFFVASSFSPNNQVISIYYLVNATEPITAAISITPHNYLKKKGGQSFRWIAISALSENDFTLIIDKRVGEMIVEKFGKN